MKNFGILTDVTLCIGCESCVTACKNANNTGEDLPWRWKRDITDLSAERWTTILRKDNHYIRKQCRHCLEPACVSACLVGALQKTPEGPVIYDGDICMGCRYCMMSCPFDIPRYLWSASIPYVRKCIMCNDLIKSGELQQPACTSSCPVNATIFGDRDELLSIAKKRIEDNPGKYISKVYGESEVGGTSVMYISDIELDFLGWKKNLGQKPLPQNTWMHLKKVPWLFGSVGILMGGVWWIIERRMKLQGFDESDTEKINPQVESDDEIEKNEKREL